MLETSLANQRLKAELEAQMQLLVNLVPKFQHLTASHAPPSQIQPLVTQNFDKINQVALLLLFFSPVGFGLFVCCCCHSLIRFPLPHSNWKTD